MKGTRGTGKCHLTAGTALDVLEDDCDVCAEQGRILDEFGSVNGGAD